MPGTRILIVDDELLNRQFLRYLLEPDGYLIDEAGDGARAWDILQRATTEYDAILLDWSMPQMDGLQLLAKIKGDKRLALIPVIMQTARDDEQNIVEAINAGVYYYLTKPYDGDVLSSIVRSATQEYAHRQRMEDEIAKRKGAIGLMISGRFRLRRPVDAESLAVLLASGAGRSPAVAMGLSELMLNGIEHGNLALDYSQKSHLIAAGKWDEFVADRLAEPAYKDRWLTVDVRNSNGEISYTITDEGEGFDWLSYQDIDAARLFETHGRGIAMARKLAFDHLRYRGRGNVVEAIIHTDDGNTEPAPSRPLVVLRGGLAKNIADRLRAIAGIEIGSNTDGRSPSLVVGAIGDRRSDDDVPFIAVAAAGGAHPKDTDVVYLPPEEDLVEAYCRALVLPGTLEVGEDGVQGLHAALASHLSGLCPDPKDLGGSSVSLSAITFPSVEVSGDTWGGALLPDGRRFIFIADMTGHGPLAGAHAIRLHQVIGQNADLFGDPAALLRRLDHDLKRVLPVSDYAAMLAGVFSPDSGSFVYAAAGVPDPLVVSDDGVTPGQGKGMPAGATGAFPFANRELEVPAGAALILATDGLGHTLMPDGSLAEVQHMLSAELAGGRVSDASACIGRLLEGAARPYPDDITMICILRAR
jgi:sigma-B regulation protein RsbU (phosphoserine phosphatase)